MRIGVSRSIKLTIAVFMFAVVSLSSGRKRKCERSAGKNPTDDAKSVGTIGPR